MFKAIKNFFNRNNDTEVLADILAAMQNVSVSNSSSALTGFDLFKFMSRERNFNSVSRGLTISAVFCAFDMYVGAVKTLPRHVTQIDTKTGKRIKEVFASDNVHPGIRIFLHYANPDLTSDELVGLIANDVLADGNFYAIKQFDSQGRVLRIHYVHPSRIPKGNIFYSKGTEVFENGKKVPKGVLVYRIETGDSTNSIKSEAKIFTKDSMVHIKSSMLDVEHNRGLGIIESASKNLDFSQRTEDYGMKFFENGINSQTYLSTDKTLSPEVYKRLESYFVNNPDNPLHMAFKTRILDNNLKPVNVAIPLEQLQFIQTRAFSVEDIARWFKIPPELLHSRMGTTNISNVGELINLFIQFGIGPLLTHISNSLKAELLPLSSQLGYLFEFERIYLYRTVINEFSQAIRNLFEIGIIDRNKISDMIGVYVDPADKFNAQRMLPTNLMTTEHSKALEEKAKTANLVMEQQLKALTLQNENYVPPREMHEMQMEAKDKADTSKDAEKPDSKDKSPDDHNIDKKVRTAKNAFTAVINGLQTYLEKVITQKNEKYAGNLEERNKSVNEFWNNKFDPLVRTTLEEWEPILNEVSNYKTVDELVSLWYSDFEKLIKDINDANSSEPTGE